MRGELSLCDERDSNVLFLRKFGFRLGRGGLHIGRTIMLEDLQRLFQCVNDPSSQKADYVKAIVENNCLGKRSGKNKELSSRFLATLYSLDPSVAAFRGLRYFWERDIEAQPLLALLCAYSRDDLLRMSAPFVLSLKEGETVHRETFAEFLEKKAPGRFSESSLNSLVRNLCGTWTRSGHLVEMAGKFRSRAKATAGSVAYALFIGYLLGIRGENLFSSQFGRLLDCSAGRSIELAEEASRRGWIVFNHLAKVMEVQFPNLLTSQEREWTHQQN
jgi:hypothetical protein